MISDKTPIINPENFRCRTLLSILTSSKAEAPTCRTMKIIGGVLLFSFGIAVRAANYVVQVAPLGSLVYNPNNVTAAVGDTVEFQFEWAVCHSIPVLSDQ